MSAARHLHPDQLAMFMPAGVLANPKKVEHADLGYDTTTTKELRFQKVSESKTGSENNALWTARHGQPSLHESIRQHGVQTPVEMSPYGPTVMNGHHRVFSAADIDPKMEIPVEWYD